MECWLLVCSLCGILSAHGGEGGGVLGQTDFFGKSSASRLLLWSADSPRENLARLSIVRGDPAEWLPRIVHDPSKAASLNVSHVRRASEQGSFEALGADYWSESALLSNGFVKYIEQMSTDSSLSIRPTSKIAGTTGDVPALAVDWLHRHVYWTAPNASLVAMASYVTPGRQRIVVRTVGDEPSAIAVNPILGYLYWSTSTWAGSTIERSDLLGSEPAVTVIQEREPITSLLVDYPSGKLYFVRRYLKVFTCDPDGANLQEIPDVTVGMSGAEPRTLIIKDLAIVQDMLLLMDKDVMFLSVHNKTSGNYMGSIMSSTTDGRLPEGIAISSPERQPVESGSSVGCRDSSCDHFCVVRASGSQQCACDYGYSLSSDKAQCQTAKSVSDNFVLVGDALNADLYQVDLAGTGVAVAVPIIFPAQPAAFTYQAAAQLVYWVASPTVAGKDTIRRATLAGESTEVFTLLDGSVSALALDETGARLYFTSNQAGRGQVGWLATIGGQPQTTIATSVHETTALALDYRRRTVYWSECGPSPRIMKAHMDSGHGRQTFLASLGQNNDECSAGIAIDIIDKKIYWSQKDSEGLSLILRANLDGSATVVLLRKQATTSIFTGIAMDERLLYVADLHSRDLITIDKDTKKVGAIGEHFFGNVHDIYLYNSAYAAAIDKVVVHCDNVPCANGGTCIDNVSSFKCVCAPGYTGSDCQTNIAECESSPCKNGSTCKDGINSYTCTCVSGYSGAGCQETGGGGSMSIILGVTISVLVVLIAAAVIGVIVYKTKKAKTLSAAESASGVNNPTYYEIHEMGTGLDPPEPTVGGTAAAGQTTNTSDDYERPQRTREPLGATVETGDDLVKTPLDYSSDRY